MLIGLLLQGRRNCNFVSISAPEALIVVIVESLHRRLTLVQTLALLVAAMEVCSLLSPAESDH